MPISRAPVTAPRKAPKQARSAHLVDAIVQAAIRVLSKEGAHAFTTIRVATVAGISVGSLYQYFPNKESILFRLQQDEWAATGNLIDTILTDEGLPATTRLRKAIRAFFRTEFDEAPLRRALGSAASAYRDAPQAKEQRLRGLPILLGVLDEAAPGLTPRHRNTAASLYIATLTSLGEHTSETQHTAAQVDRWAQTTADMYLAYLATLTRRC